VDELGPTARAATSAEAAEAADLAVVTIPLGAIPDVPTSPLAGKTVVDTNNYCAEGWRTQRDTPVCGPRLDAATLREKAAEAKGYREA
jgi:predicted dinucleotide-binding enzyme